MTHRRRTLCGTSALLALAAACTAHPTVARAADAGPASADSGPAGLLRLAGDDAFEGRWLPSDEADAVRWQTPIAEEAFEFPAAHVLALQLHQDAAPPVDAPYALELDRGDLLLGRLLKLTDAAAEFAAPPLGVLHIERRRLRRLSAWGPSTALAYHGPQGREEWAAHPPERVRDEGGSLVVDAHASAELGACVIPPQALVEIELSWQRKPDFRLQFGVHPANPEEGGLPGPAAETPPATRARTQRRATPAAAETPPARSAEACFQLETFSGWLVLVREQAAAADLATLEKVERGPGRIHLLLHYDAQQGSVAAYAAQGKLLAEVRTPPSGTATPRGVRLTTFVGDARLERLAVRASNGVAPPPVGGGLPSLATSSGELLVAESVTYDDATGVFTLRPAAATGARPRGELQVPRGEASFLQFGGAASAPEPPQDGREVRVQCVDGQRISGRLERMAEGRATIRRDGLREPLAVPVSQIRSVVSLKPVAPADENDPRRIARLEAAGTSARGRVTGVAVRGAASVLAWQPLASRNASPLRSRVAATLVYRQPPAAPQIAEHSPAADGRPPQPGRRPEPAEPAFDDSAKPAREEQLLWLREGDRLPCRVVAIDEQGVAFATSVASATFLPHARIRAWERQSGLPLPTLDAGRMKRLLTLPRAQQAHPPTHVIESTGGDLLRTRLQRMDSEQAVVEVRLQEQQLARAEISRIIWLHPGEPALGPPSKQEADGTSTPARDAAANVPPEQPSSAAEPAWTAQVQAVRDDGVRLTFHPTGFADGVLAGQREGLGDCRVDLADVERLLLGAALEAAADNHPYAAWQLAAAPQPRFVAESTAGPDSAAESDSPLAGRPAPDFALTTLAGAHYRLAERRGQVVVLDFWASWCGPCIEALPQAEAVAAEFSAERVRLTAVNVQEDAATAEAALARLAARPETVLDRDGAVAAQYAVSAIPQTVVIDAAGRVREVLVGGGPQYADRLRIAIRAALDEAPRAQPTTSP